MCDGMKCPRCSEEALKREEKKDNLKRLIDRFDDNLTHYEFIALKTEVLSLIDSIK